MKVWFALFLLMGLVISAGPATSTSATFEHGTFRFADITTTMQDYAGRNICGFRAHVFNETDSLWQNARFEIRVQGTDKAGNIAEFYLEAFSTYIGFEKRAYDIIANCPIDQAAITVTEASAEFLGGERTPSPEAAAKETAALESARRAEEAQRQAAVLAAKKKAEKATADRLAYLAKFPVLFNSNEAVFIGSDQKCSDQFVQALSMDGLEKRKKLADLLAYGCGFLVPSKTHVEAVQRDATHTLVRPLEGTVTGKVGWVPSTWVK